MWRAEPGEAPEVARLMREFGEWFSGSALPEDEIRASVERIMAGSDGEFFVGARNGGPPQGICQVRFRWSLWRSAEDAWLEDLFIREEARRTGLGRALVEAVVARARERGCKRIELDVQEDNAPARALYVAAGFLEEPKGGRTMFISKPL